jgi:hypothetical protein
MQWAHTRLWLERREMITEIRHGYTLDNNRDRCTDPSHAVEKRRRLVKTREYGVTVASGHEQTKIHGLGCLVLRSRVHAAPVSLSVIFLAALSKLKGRDT